MADVALLALLSLVLQDVDLLALAVLDDLSLNSCAFNDGSAELGVLTIQNCQNLLERDSFVSLVFQLLDVQDITLGNSVLLAASYDNCFHLFHLLYFV